MNTLIAIPSEQPGGMQAAVAAHFGHCELYTLVQIENEQIAAIDTIPNIPHQQGGCMAPVQYLADKGVRMLIAGGMGLRPLQGFRQVGIDVFFGNGAADVQTAVDALIAGRLQRFNPDQTCGGHHQSNDRCRQG